MTRKRSSRILIALLVAAVMLVPAAVASADSHGGEMAAPPIPITGPRLSPPAISHTDVIDPYTVYNENLIANLPAQSLEADAADGGATQEKPGRGIKQTVTSMANGIHLYGVSMVCNDFNTEDQWPSTTGATDVWTDWFAGWAPYAVDNGNYQAKNVTFSRERVVGPGSNFGDNEHSAKIASNQPYAAGFGSPTIPVPDGYADGSVYVAVNYLIWDHDQGGMDYDWASMGIKAGAAGEYATYVNGYVRGEWAQMEQVIPLDGASDVMVLLQAHSPGSFNSNIYFDNVQIAFVDAANSAAYLADCTLEP
jgi:hypothetical protein